MNSISIGLFIYLFVVLFVGNKVGIFAVLGIISGLIWGLGYIGQPHLLIWYMAINKSSQLKTEKGEGRMENENGKRS